MKHEFTDKKFQSLFGFTDFLQKDNDYFLRYNGINKIIWNRNSSAVPVYIDDIEHILNPGNIITTTFFHRVNFIDKELPLTGILFNREFYCLSDNDSEISCNGILFFGTQDIPVIRIPTDQIRKFKLLLDVILEEFQTKDNIQGDMLQMLLKRLIIICTRLAKEQLVLKTFDDSQIDVIRKFNFLVDIHFKTKRQVKDYADLLNKSPKTLSNLFALYNQKSPRQIIHERVVLEAKRQMLFTDKQTQEIAYDLGFEDPTHFSRFFKKIEKVTPSKYKETYQFSS